MKLRITMLAVAALALTWMGCERGGTPDPAEPAEPAAAEGSGEEAEEEGIAAGRGVDAEAQVIRIGNLHDQSGPAAAIGVHFATGKQLLAAQVNAGGSGLLPDGWTIELVDRDHGYNPQRSVEAYNEIKEEVLFIGTSFGTPNTLPLRPHLERDSVVAFPASLSSELASHQYTPPLGPSYLVEAMRAMDWVVENVGDASTVQVGIVYQRDDYGQDGLNGWQQAAEHHGVTIVSEQTVDRKSVV